MRYIASCSFGKDSLAMVLYLIETKQPLDEVVFYDTGMEFQAIYDIRDKVLPLLHANGIKYTELKPDRPFLYDMLEKPKKGGGIGYQWCGANCRWGTTFKNLVCDRYKATLGEDVTEYIGIAYDESNRAKEKTYPLIAAKMKEADCLRFCRERGFDWVEHTENGDVVLYDILDRVSCWCCCRKNRKELKNIYRYLPEYWEKLKWLQAQIQKPFQKFKNKKYGEYGNIFDMEKVFEKEIQEANI